MVQMLLNSAHLPITSKGRQGINTCERGLMQAQAPRQAPKCSFRQKMKMMMMSAVRGRARWSNQLPIFDEFISDLGPADIHRWPQVKTAFVCVSLITRLRGYVTALNHPVPGPAVTGAFILLANLGLN